MVGREKIQSQANAERLSLSHQQILKLLKEIILKNKNDMHIDTKNLRE